MRSATKTFVGLAGIGVLVATARLGLPAATATPAATVSSETASTPAPTQSAVPTSTAPKTTPVKKVVSRAVSKTGSAVGYKYGTVQVKVTKKSGVITAVSYLKATATDGRAAVFPDLVSAAKSANGTNFSNISGATFTVTAFKKALKSALAKF